jgi:transcriptional regulator with XRE-family HTH domain
MPKENLPLVATMISDRIDRLASHRNQSELAKSMGFKSANMLSMIRRGKAKLPFNKIPIVAKVLDLDAALLLRTHLREEWPEFESAVFEIFGGVLTNTEKAWLEFFVDIGMPTLPVDREKRQELREFFEALKE